MAEHEPTVAQEARRYLAMLHKRRGLAVTCVVVSLIVAFLINYTSRPLYQATTQILIDVGTQNILSAADVNERAEVKDLETQLQLLRGRNLGTQVVERLGLQKHRELQSGPLMSPLERLRNKIMGSSSPDRDDELRLSPAVAAFRSRVSVEPLPGSRLVNLRFRGYDPEVAKDAANALAQLFVEESFRIRQSTSAEATGWLSDQLDQQQARIKLAEEELREYQQQAGLGNIEERDRLLKQKLDTLSQAATQARMQRIEKETLASQLRATPGSQLDSFPTIMVNPAVQGLRSRVSELERERIRLSATLGDKHPEMVQVTQDLAAARAKLDGEVRSIARSLETDVRAARQEEARLTADLESAKRELVALDQQTVEYRVLRRELNTNQELVDTLLTRSGETGLQADLGSAGDSLRTNIRIIELAELPVHPVSPNRTRNLQLGLLIGLGLGIGLALLLEHLDNSVKTPDDVKNGLGLPFLGMIPQVAQSAGPSSRKSRRLMSEAPQSAVAEAYRLLRTNLIFSTAKDSGRVIVISSANPSEGKTTTVANIAASLAQNGSKVLAVDADLRRPTLHQHFGLHKAPGLSDLIIGKVQPSEAIQDTRFKGLQVLPCGYVPPNPAELLGSRNMREVLEALRAHYDWVLVDSPPILAMADTPVLCGAAIDGLALVVAAESTTRPNVTRAVEQVTSVGGHILGVILNGVNIERNSYYYSQYYGEYYRSYYAEGSSKQRDRPIRIVRRA
jgi:capsular exopolysaccharide synthesis family protein